MLVTNQLKNQHLAWRAGFGPRPEDFDMLRQASQKALLKAMVKASSKSPEYIDVADNALKGLVMGIDDAGRRSRAELSDEQRKQLRKQSAEDIRNLNLQWVDQMVNSEKQLREKMAFFWHGHFACRNVNIFYAQLLLDPLRQHALGNFGDLLREVSKSAGMINFLNNNQNRKDHPNENFAREVMELFTMGRGNYTEQDVKEAARAFTGWGADLNGQFVFRRGQHDNGSKTFLGKTGNFDGDQILDILLAQKQTARFITTKIYRFFVNDTPDPQHIDWLANRFYQSGYEIQPLMEDIFSADWFYDAKNIGTRIKSPVELLAGIRRIIPMQLDNPDIQLLIQRLLGQVLFNPPNVAGWPGGKSWIDSSSLMFRLRLPQMIQQQSEINLKPKSDDDQMMGMKENRPMRRGMQNGNQQILANMDWKAYTQKFESVPREKLMNEISTHLLQTLNGGNIVTAGKYADASGRENFIQTATIRLMSTPEYQLC
jgi:uncharacterized protein (DUF1800 family)